MFIGDYQLGKVEVVVEGRYIAKEEELSRERVQVVINRATQGLV